MKQVVIIYDNIIIYLNVNIYPQPTRRSGMKKGQVEN